MLNVFIGVDLRETLAYHVLCQSILERCTVTVAITPLHTPMLRGDWQGDGTNAFTYSRFLVPELMGFKGQAIYLDSDMLVLCDLSKLFVAPQQAVAVCKHDYETRNPVKLIGTPMECKNEHYPRKNWSSMVVWNCAHQQNRILTRDFVAEAGGRRLHRFEWLKDDEIGSLPLEYNHIIGELPPNTSAKIAHFSLGCPGFYHYRKCEHAREWHETAKRVTRMDHLSLAQYA